MFHRVTNWHDTSKLVLLEARRTIPAMSKCSARLRLGMKCAFLILGVHGAMGAGNCRAPVFPWTPTRYPSHGPITLQRNWA